MSVVVYACARCGIKPREDDTFLCGDCLDDPQRVKAQAAAEATYPGDHHEQRRLLISSWGWAGWAKRIKGATRA